MENFLNVEGEIRRRLRVRILRGRGLIGVISLYRLDVPDQYSPVRSVVKVDSRVDGRLQSTVGIIHWVQPVRSHQANRR